MSRRFAVLAMAVLVGATAACGEGDDETFVATTTTTSPVTSTTEAPTTTVVPSTSSPSRVTTSTAAPRPTSTPTTAARTPVEVDSGTSPSGAWRLLAEPGGRPGLVCAALRVQSQDAGRVCNEASEQDSNGNETLRYSLSTTGSFVIGVGVPGVARVRAEMRDDTVVERATVAAPFTTAARFVALPLPANVGIRALVALDAGGRVLTRIPVNP